MYEIIHMVAQAPTGSSPCWRTGRRPLPVPLPGAWPGVSPILAPEAGEEQYMQIVVQGMVIDYNYHIGPTNFHGDLLHTSMYSHGSVLQEVPDHCLPWQRYPQRPEHIAENIVIDICVSSLNFQLLCV